MSAASGGDAIVPYDSALASSYGVSVVAAAAGAVPAPSSVRKMKCGDWRTRAHGVVEAAAQAIRDVAVGARGASGVVDGRAAP